VNHKDGYLTVREGDDVPQLKVLHWKVDDGRILFHKEVVLCDCTQHISQYTSHKVTCSIICQYSIEASNRERGSI